ncbi:MAG TPA: MASE1 domain-containing protein [Dyella sp.]|uniref:MASE1 domain-containing protein n=1 Tax=Dyella sp. TaxID=1869338 RepID=UPI002C786974|nr:MASE1 domain-containing protein [Dyella sp.]HTV87136.1 MASE1 domain-containing protein [Dyella sp.]
MLRQAAVALGYVAVYALIRPVSDAHWELLSGLRLALLLLIPYRYWAALAVGDTITSAYQSSLSVAQFGLGWGLANAVPFIALAMPVVWFCREKLALFPSRQLVNFQTLLLCTLAVPMVWALANYAAMSLAKNPGVAITPILVVYLFVGSYVALLTTIPWVIIAKLEYRSGMLLKRLRGFVKSSMALDAAGILIPSQLILSWLTLHGKEDKQVYCLFMFLPVAWLTLKHGWRAAVMGGTIVVACINVLMNYDTPDPMVLQVQSMIAFAITCLIAMGARISALHQREAQERVDVEQAMRLARQSLQVGEMRLRQASETLEYVCGEMQVTQNRLLNRFRMMLPANESQMYSKQAATAQEKMYQIADAMHPIAWRRRGLRAALRENLGRALDEAGIAYNYQVKGRGFGAHAANLHTMIYRLACESVVYICANVRCSDVQLTLRGVDIDGNRLVVLRIAGHLDGATEDSTFFRQGQRDRLAHKLGVTGLDLVELRDHVRLFNGQFHVRPSDKTLQLTFLLQDVAEQEWEQNVPAPTPMRLWAS